MDATPLLQGQEMSGWGAMLDSNRSQLEDTLKYVRAFAIGGTAVGTGINAHPEFGDQVASKITEYTGKRFFQRPISFRHSLLMTRWLRQVVY